MEIWEPKFEQYRKKPVIIEAYRYELDYPTQIATLEGVMTVSPGDWVIKGVKGELYPCKDDIFQMTYEKVGSKNMDEFFNPRVKAKTMENWKGD